MRKKLEPMWWTMFVAIVMFHWLASASGQTPPQVDVQSTFDTVEARVLKVYSVEEDGHRFVAYSVKWKDSEVIVSDPLADSNFQEGDNIRFIAQKISLPGSPINISSLNFHLLSAPDVADLNGASEDAVSPEESQRSMRIVQGDLDSTKNEIERFYALNKAARIAWRKGEIEKARALATELKNLAPNYVKDWNYGNAIQDSNQVLGLIALEAGNVAEAKKRLLASADSKGSPQMNSFGPNMQLAKALLEKGENDAVLEYFERCATFWTMGETRLATWTESVKKGEIPDFGANLKY